MDPVLPTAMMDWPPLLPAEMHIVGNCPTVGANSPMNEKKPPVFKAVPRVATCIGRYPRLEDS